MLIITLIKILIILGLFVLFSIKRLPLFVILFTATILLGIFFLPIKEVLTGFWKGISCEDSLIMMFLIWLIVSFTKLIEEGKGISNASEILRKSVRNPIILFPFFPALIGLFPMPGGALVSAPMLNTMSGNSGLSKETQGVINFWFRHIWEPIWPLYPGIIFTLQILKISFGQLFLHLFFITIFAFLGAFLFIILPNKKKITTENQTVLKKFSPLKFLYQLWPVFILIVTIPIIPRGVLSLSILVISLSIIYTIERRLSFGTIFKSIKTGFSLKLLLLIPVIFIFKYYIEKAEIINFIIQFSNTAGLPIELIIFIVSFILGLLFGITIGFISVALPLFLPFILTSTGVNFYPFVYLFVGGYIGVFFSPMHLCLVLTKEYFNASLFKMYKKMILPGLFLVIFSLIFNYVLNK
jgi:integral membrane protein (TIGR00529 family)